jgi:hypothetical protein
MARKRFSGRRSGSSELMSPWSCVYFAWLLDAADPDARTFVRHEIPRPALLCCPAHSAASNRRPTYGFANARQLWLRYAGG